MMCPTGEGMNTTSDVVRAKNSMMLRFSWSRVLWLCSAPFGAEVVPDV